MAKRAVSYAPVVRAVRSVCKVLFTPSPAAASPKPVEQLETRVLMSSSLAIQPADVSTYSWKGHSVTAYTGQYIGQIASPALFQKLTVKLGFSGVQSLSGENLYRFDTAIPVKQVQQFAAKYPNTFSLVEPNAYESIRSVLPNDPGLPLQYGINNTGQLQSYDYNGDGAITPYNYQLNSTPPATIQFPSPPYPNENHYGIAGDDIDAKDAWSITTGSPNVVVAVVDTGLDITHPDVIPNLWTNPLDTAANNYNGDGFPGDIHGYNFADNNADVMDENGHGTNVAGIVGAAGDNGIGVDRRRTGPSNCCR